jgi:alkyldihydroxyacetonephosphate synthase
MNELVHSNAAARLLGGSLLVVVFEGLADEPAHHVEETRRLVEATCGGAWEGAGPAERWFEHRYAVSYRQAPVFAHGAFVDTFEVAAPWSRLGALYEGVRRALAEHAFVMAHFSHAYPDGCCIYFSFAGVGRSGGLAGRLLGRRAADWWDEACEEVYDRSWRAALAAAVEAGGTIAHHHGVGRSKAPRLEDEVGAGVDIVRGLMRAMDPDGILNPGNLVARERTSSPPVEPMPARAVAGPGSRFARPDGDDVIVDRTSLLADVDGRTTLEALEARLASVGLTLDAPAAPRGADVAGWLAGGARGARDRWLDPVDQLLAGLDATLAGGRRLCIRAAPRRATGPDLTALFVGSDGRFGRVDRACLRVHPRGVARPQAPPFRLDRTPPLSTAESALLDAIALELRGV